MIFKTIYTRNSAAGWIGYIGYKSSKSKYLGSWKEFKGVFNGVGERVRRYDIKWLLENTGDGKIARMLIFSPARSIEPPFLAEYTREAIWRFINEQGRNSMRFVYALHYNTPHPHAHAILASYLPEDIVLYKREVKRISDIASDVFMEGIDIHRKLSANKYREPSKYEKMIAEWEKAIETESKSEIIELRKLTIKTKTVDDVMSMISL